jgi:LacI family transcriptional regulator
VVIIDHYTPNETLSRVVTDEFTNAVTMIRHLVRLGHRRIGFCHCGLPGWNGSDIQRFQGYRQGLAEANINGDDSLALECGTLTVDDSKSIFPERIRDFLNRPDRPSAIVAYTDMLAIKIMNIARKMGLRIPDDIAIVGFDNILMSEYAVPPLTTVTHSGQQVGRRAAELLFEQISGISDQPMAPVYERIPGELVVRESCGVGCRR